MIAAKAQKSFVIILFFVTAFPLGIHFSPIIFEMGFNVPRKGMTNENKDSSTELSPASKLSLHDLFPIINICVYPYASVVLSNHPGFHIILSVTPSGFDFVENRCQGFRFAPSPSVICRPIGTKRKPERLADYRQGCSAAEPLLRYHHILKSRRRRQTNINLAPNV